MINLDAPGCSLSSRQLDGSGIRLDTFDSPHSPQSLISRPYFDYPYYSLGSQIYVWPWSIMEQLFASALDVYSLVLVRVTCLLTPAVRERVRLLTLSPVFVVGWLLSDPSSTPVICGTTAAGRLLSGI